MRRPLLLLALAAVLLVAVVAPAMAERDFDFVARLSPDQEVAHVDAPDAEGLAKFKVDGNVLRYEVVVRGLTGSATMAHIHGPADRGVNAGISIWLCGTTALPGPAGTPTCSPTTNGELVTGSVTVTSEQLAMLDAGLGYANVHTALHPAGEVRGQVRPPDRPDVNG
ncbi:MAG TPA: CHRD domain-containing protein [Acidimicrobiia bacterium]|nr:CHRD domain-containing protein [Acidimicrobiia bacterium]